MEEQRTEVLNQEDGAPSQLGAQVFDEELVELQVAQQRLAVLQGLVGGRVEEANAVVVADAGLAGDGDLDVVDIGSGGQVERRGKSLDGLFACCYNGNKQPVSTGCLHCASCHPWHDMSVHQETGHLHRLVNLTERSAAMLWKYWYGQREPYQLLGMKEGRRGFAVHRSAE